MNSSLNKIDFRNAFFDEMYNVASKNKKLIFLTGDISAHSLPKFQKKFPDRFYNLGITEQSMVTIASGLAMSNKKVFMFSMIPFLTMRCYEHIKIDICSHKLPVTLIGLGSGLSYHNDGHSAQATFDIGVMRMLPELSIFNPSDAISATKICKILSANKEPSYIRLDKSQQKIIYNKKENFNSDFKLIGKKKNLCLISTGVMVHKCLELSKMLEKKGIPSSILDLYKLKPIDERKMLNTLKKFKKIAVVDENTFSGGISSIISEIFTKNNFTKPIQFFCLKNEQCFKYGQREWLHKKYSIDLNSIFKKISN